MELYKQDNPFAKKCISEIKERSALCGPFIHYTIYSTLQSYLPRSYQVEFDADVSQEL